MSLQQALIARQAVQPPLTEEQRNRALEFMREAIEALIAPPPQMVD